MNPKRSVLIVGLDPTVVDYSAFPDLDATKVQAGLDAERTRLNGLGYDADVCLTDLGATAETVVRDALGRKPYDCVVVGAGVRTAPTNFLLFERLINVIHEHAPRAKLCFNTKPTDTVEAVQRWV
jgi:hypothetical protein